MDRPPQFIHSLRVYSFNNYDQVHIAVMVNANGSPPPGIRCREIGAADAAGVATLLRQGFPNRNRAFWLGALDRLSRHRTPAGFPKYGYLLESGGVPVGAILLIFSSFGAGEAAGIRCNVSSWYVQPSFRSYASLLVSKALRHKNVTYMNVSAAPHTWPIIEAQGFSRYCNGIFIALPILNVFPGAHVRVGAEAPPDVDCEPFEREVLARHAEQGCISLWCAGSERAHPFVFRPRLVKGIAPCAQLIYCRDVGDLVHFAGPIGRYLALRGMLFVVVDANGPIPGLIGTFRNGRMPKYFKGPVQPRLGDLAYTEYAMLGV
jgi:hypothetical protein